MKLAKTFLFALALCLAVSPAAHAAPLVRAGAGSNIAEITPFRDQFRTDLGGGTTAGANGSFGGQRREINWDGVPDASSAPNNLPANFFNVNSPRGVVFSTAGTGFQVSATSTSGTPVEFGNINGTYPSQFDVFSPQRLFSQLGSNVMDVDFFVPGTQAPATVKGFGAIFTDVDLPNVSRMDFFDTGGNLMHSENVPQSGGINGGFSFLGVSFTAGERVAKVRITLGNSALGPDEGSPGPDVVVMDDFLYGEPDDGDGVATASDNCPGVSNAGQENLDGDAEGDACDADDDNDGVPDASDAFPRNAAESADTDGDGTGDNADQDDDNDGLSDTAEATVGSDPKRADTDGDGRLDGADNCVLVSNAGQADRNADGQGDACDDLNASGLSRLRATPRAFRSRPGASLAQRAPRGTSITYTLTEAATVQFTVERVTRGRRVGRRCVRGTPRPRRGRARACTIYTALPGSFAHTGVAGSNGFRFTGALNGSALRAGRYRLTGIAVDADGNASTPARAPFKVVRR